MYDVEEQVEMAVEWIDSLAANEFKQAKSMMGSMKDGFCCLGVQRHLTKVSDWKEEDLDVSFPEDHEFDTLGMQREPQGVFCGRLYALTALNDHEKQTFPDIARAILVDPWQTFVPEVAEGVAEHYYK